MCVTYFGHLWLLCTKNKKTKKKGTDQFGQGGGGGGGGGGAGLSITQTSHIHNMIHLHSLYTINIKGSGKTMLMFKFV